ncbi:unnamed protein product [Adineta ricciae]|uniref:NAD(P)(+)--arginine ADP-ribosyltransferase n=1 Tax=Adineta ricciae TaxID=249248 RepID=A0A815E9Z3_ADIRI|nr:unnamed protein product [Adineta ricciae]CAF1433336.1 unnamed protein product [Adineta ricciae]
MTTRDYSQKRILSNESLSGSHSVKKTRNEVKSVFGQLNISFQYSIIWYNEQQKNPLEYYNINTKFRRGIIDYLECFVNINEYKNYIASLTNDRPHIIIIISIFTSTELIDIFNCLKSNDLIYIHQGEFNSDVTPSLAQSQIRGTYDDLTQLFSDVSKEASIMNRENFICKTNISSNSSCIVNDRTTCFEAGSNNDYFVNFLDMLMETEASPSGKQVFVEECRRLFENQQSILRIVDEFDRTYVSDRAVYWYTRNGFLYTLVNQTLRQQNIEALLFLHFFIRDLDRQLLSEIQEPEDYDWKKLSDLYRGQRMSTVEIESLKLSYQQGVFQSFVSTTINIEVARMFSGGRAIAKDDPVQPVLFYFDCSQLKLSRGVANIQHLSDNDAEEEVLFSPLYSFSVRDVDYDEDEHVWKVQCSMNGDETNLPLLLHQRLIKLDIAVRILISTTASFNSDSNEEICQLFTNGMMTLLDELVIPEGNIVTLDENAQVQKNTKHAVTALFLLKGLKSFNTNSLAHKPAISNDTFAALWDCLATMYKERGEFQRALDYFEKAQTYSIENMPIVIARKINIAQVNRMIGQYARTWSIYQELLDECIQSPDKDNFNIFSQIATDIPDVESEHAMEIWYPNIFNYLEYVYTQCQEKAESKPLFNDELRIRYRALGHAYWYLVHNEEQTLVCYNRWKELLDEKNESLGEFFMYLAHVYYNGNPIRAKSLYEQAIVELSIAEEAWPMELAICYSRLGCLQKTKRFFIRRFYLLIYVIDLSILQRKYLEEAGECYLYLAKSYDEQNLIIDKTTAEQYCQQALRLFLNVKPPTSNFREMKECITHLITLQENHTENNFLQKIYDEPPVNEQQLKQMLEQTLRTLNGQKFQSELIDEEIGDENSD